jgi:hypothetical protein
MVTNFHEHQIYESHVQVSTNWIASSKNHRERDSLPHMLTGQLVSPVANTLAVSYWSFMPLLRSSTFLSMFSGLQTCRPYRGLFVESPRHHGSEDVLNQPYSAGTQTHHHGGKSGSLILALQIATLSSK